MQALTATNARVQCRLAVKVTSSTILLPVAPMAVPGVWMDAEWVAGELWQPLRAPRKLASASACADPPLPLLARRPRPLAPCALSA